MGNNMKIKSTLLEGSLLVTLVTCAALSSSSADAGLFSKIKNKVKDAVNETGDVIVDTGGNIIDETGDVFDRVDIEEFALSELTIDPVTGFKKIKTPFESSTEFTAALQKGEWQSISSAIKDESVIIGLGSGANLLQIKNSLNQFDDQVSAAYKGSSRFALNVAEASQVGAGIKLIRNTLSQCVGSSSDAEDCFNDFVAQFINYYKLIWHYVEKVNELKSYAKGDGYKKITDRINSIQKKSVKYFLPILENSQDQLSFSKSNNNISDKNDIHHNFEEYYSISDIRNSLEGTEYNYHLDPQKACNRVSIPIVCDDFAELDNLAINRFNYQESGLTDAEFSHRKDTFLALGKKAFGESFTESKSEYTDESDLLDYLQSELFADINWSQSLDPRIPYIVKDEVLGGAGGAFIASENDAIILLNEELFSDDTGMEEGFSNDDVYFARLVALEEIGHWLNWRRCQYKNDMEHCADTGETVGDPGAKFANAAFIEYQDLNDFNNQVAALSEGPWSQVAQLTLTSGIKATYEGNPSLTDIQTALATIDAKVRFRMRMQMGTPGSQLKVGSLGSSGIIEVNYTPPKRIKADDLVDRENYGYDDPDQNLFLGNIGIVFAIENYIGVGTELLKDAFLLPKVYGEVGLKSSFGISIPLLKESVSANNLANVDKKYRDNNMSLSYSVSPYLFNYLGLVSIGDTLKASIDFTSAVWVGNTVYWKAKTVPFSIMMAGVTIGSSGVGCVKGATILAKLPISTQLKCAIGAQVASGVMVTGTGFLASLNNDNINMDQGSGWVNGVRVKVAHKLSGLAAETRFEALFSDWTIGVNGLKAFTGNINNSNAFAENITPPDPSDNRNSQSMAFYDEDKTPQLTFNRTEFSLEAGESITTANRYLVMQYDGNLVLYRYADGVIGEALWASGTFAGSHAVVNYKAVFQGDGNLVIYNASGNAKWASRTQHSGDRLVLQEDGNLVMYSNSKGAVWSTGTTSIFTQEIDNPSSLEFFGGEFSLEPGQYITTDTRRLVMKHDGNLALYYYHDGVLGHQLWESRASTGSDYRAVFQSDGNLVIYNAYGKAKWATGTNPSGSRLKLQSDGNLVIYSSSGKALWSTVTHSNNDTQIIGDSLNYENGSFTLKAGESIMTKTRQFIMQYDGNLALYSYKNGEKGNLLWETATYGSNYKAVFQSDGNLVVYNSNGSPKWASKTQHTGERLELQEYGNLAIYSDSDQLVWETGTNSIFAPISVPGGGTIQLGKSSSSDGEVIN